MTGLNIAIRILHLCTSLVLACLFTFLLLVARPALHARKSDSSLALAQFDINLLRLAGWSLLVLACTALLGLWGQLAVVTGRPPLQALAPDSVWSMLSTQYGRVWLVRLALMTLLGGILWLRGQEQN